MCAPPRTVRSRPVTDFTCACTGAISVFGSIVLIATIGTDDEQDEDSRDADADPGERPHAAILNVYGFDRRRADAGSQGSSRAGAGSSRRGGLALMAG